MTKLKQMNKKDFSELFIKYWLLMVVVLLGIGIGSVESAFLKPTNLMSVLSTACLAGISSCGLVCVQAVGELDFSTGATMSWAASVLCVLLDRGHVDNFATAAMLAVGACLLVGIMNAVSHIIFGIPAFLATLATANIMKGMALLITDNTTIYKGNWDSDIFTFLGQHRVFGYIPMPFVVFLIVAGIMMFVLECTKVGKNLYAVGANPKACDYIGIHRNLYKALAFMLCSLLCGISGIIQASVTNGGGPASGDSFQLQTILVCILGSTFIKKGITNIPGALVGSILVTMVANAITLIGASTFVQYASQALILLAGVIMSVIIRRRNERV